MTRTIRSFGERFATPLIMAGLFALNAYLCHELFSLEISQMIGSIEAAFISFSRWLADHWGDRSWFPLWASGMPSRQVYGPALHTFVAWLTLVTRWTPQHAYHFVTAVTYCLGPVTLFWLCWKTTGRRWFALLAGLLYSLFSPSTFVVAEIRDNVLGHWNARRYQALVEYGEGPHVTALMLIPLVIWLLEEAASARKRYHLLFAPLVLALLVLTNWTGTTGVSMAIIAYVCAKFGASNLLGGRSLHFPTLVGIGIIAYFLACVWIPPSLVNTVTENSRLMDITVPMSQKVKVLIPLLLVIAVAHVLAQRLRVNTWLRFFAYYSLITGTVLLSDYRLHTNILQLARRYHLEMELGLAGVAAYFITWIGNKLPRAAQLTMVGALSLAGIHQIVQYRNYVLLLTKPVDFTTTVEYKMAHWIADNLPGQRVLLGGTPSDWLNLYSDVPQLVGCCDQSQRYQSQRTARYVAFAGKPDKKGSGELVTVWLKTYGVAAAGVALSLQPQPYTDPHQFDGVLPEAWREGPNVIYRVSGPPYSLAHVVDKSAIVSKEPYNGLDIDPLLPLVNELDHPSSLATFRWVSQHEAEIVATTEPDQVLFVQESFDAGFHAYEGGEELAVAPDALGLTTITPRAAGPHTIRYVYGGSTEDQLMRGLQLAGIAWLLLWVFRRGNIP